MALSDVSAFTILDASPTCTHLDMNLPPFVNGAKPFPLASRQQVLHLVGFCNLASVKGSAYILAHML